MLRVRIAAVVAFGLIGAAVALALDEALYTKLYIPAARQSLLAEIDKQTDKTSLIGSGEKLRWIAPNVISADCDGEYYGCLDWPSFPGSSSILAIYNPKGDEDYGIELFKQCPRLKACVYLSDSDSYGVLISRDEFFEFVHAGSTSRMCDYVDGYGWHFYRVKLCTSKTSYAGKLVYTTYAVEFDQTIIGRTLGLWPNIGFPLYVVNRATRTAQAVE